MMGRVLPVVDALAHLVHTQARHNKEHKKTCSRKVAKKSDAAGSSGSGGGGERGDAEGEELPTRPVEDVSVLRRPDWLLHAYDERWLRGSAAEQADKAAVAPCGHRNVGNSCYANSTLSALAATRPLAAFCAQGAHSEGCKVEGWCAACELERHVRSCVESVGGSAVSPAALCKRVRAMGGHTLTFGRQEDSQDFFHTLLGSCVRKMLVPHGGERRVREREAETTAVHHVFGGYTRSRVSCCECGAVSDRYEGFLDLQLELASGSKQTDLQKVLTHYTAPEWLDGDNKYQCDACDAKVRAQKRLAVHIAPNALVITVKRYTMGSFGKNNARVAYPAALDLAPFMSRSHAEPAVASGKGKGKAVAGENAVCNGSSSGVGGGGGGGGLDGDGGGEVADATDAANGSEAGENGEAKKMPLGPDEIQPQDTARAKYRLYAIVEHMGSSFGGHYVAYVRKGGQWYAVDDSRVSKTTWPRVSAINAYMLFYERSCLRDPPLTPGQAVPERPEEDSSDDEDGSGSGASDEEGDRAAPSGDGATEVAQPAAGDAIGDAFDAAADAFGEFNISSGDEGGDNSSTGSGGDDDGMGGLVVRRRAAAAAGAAEQSVQQAAAAGGNGEVPEPRLAHAGGLDTPPGLAPPPPPGLAPPLPGDSGAVIVEPVKPTRPEPIRSMVGMGSAAPEHQLVFSLRHVQSAEEIDVGVEGRTLTLSAGPLCRGEYELPCAVEPAQLRTRWGKKTRMLTLTVPADPALIAQEDVE